MSHATTGQANVDQGNDARIGEMQASLNAFWSTRRDNPAPTALNIRTDAELRVWMESMQQLLPPAPADVVDLGTGQGFLALAFAALGHRSRGFDLGHIAMSCGPCSIQRAHFVTGSPFCVLAGA